MSLLLHHAFRRITLIINQQMHLHKISHKNTLNRSDMFRSLDHPQGATLFLAKVILKTFTN